MVSKRKRDSPPAAAVPADDDPEPELDADDDEAEAAPSPADDDRPACKYGATCFRKNPDHFLEYSHPHLSTSTGGLKKKARTDAHASSSSSSSSAAAAAAPDSPASAAPSSPASAAARSSPKLTARQRKASADPTPAAAAPVSTGSWSGGGCDDDEDADMPAATAASSSSSAAAAAAARPSSPAVNAATSKLPACPYGLSCFRKNLLHFSEYSHPIHGATTKQDGGSPRSPVAGAVAPASSSSSSAAAASSSSGAFTLQRSYSQLTESERKLLVLNALQEKSKLEAALKNKDTELAAKAKEAEHLKAELGAGLMLLPGEAEALAGSTVKTFVLHASRTHETNASSMHFRLAESQFYRLLGAGSTAKITSVEYVVSPAVAARFAEAKKKIKGVNKPVLAFHGTADANIPLITASGFKMPGTGGHKHATDTGWYGKGIYFSEYPAYSMGYIKGSTRLLLCQVLLGRVYKCTKLIHGAALVSGYDSHSSPDGMELVIFDSAHILPCYIVNFTNTPTQFSYASDEDEVAAVTSSDSVAKKLNAGMEAALVKSASSALKSYLFLLAGKYDLKQSALKSLIEKHGGQTCLKVPKSTDRTLCLLATEKSAGSLALKAKVAEVQDEGGKIINQSFVFEAILNGKKTDIGEYELDP